jgi:hypothetical protein
MESDAAEHRPDSQLTGRLSSSPECHRWSPKDEDYWCGMCGKWYIGWYITPEQIEELRMQEARDIAEYRAEKENYEARVVAWRRDTFGTAAREA